MNYAPPLRRFSAFILDIIVMLGIYMAAGLLLSLSFLAIPLSVLPMVGFWFYGSIFLLSWIYFAGFESSKYQATVGKRLLGLRVATTNGERITFVRATARYYSKLLSRIMLMIGFLMIPFTKKKQGLHDKIASTVVIVKH